jgi:hypothetical protein
MPYEFGDVVLVPFPFTSQTASKKRPAVIVSNASYNRTRPDVVVMAITSQVRSTAPSEARIVDWQIAGLLKAVRGEAGARHPRTNARHPQTWLASTERPSGGSTVHRRNSWVTSRGDASAQGVAKTRRSHRPLSALRRGCLRRWALAGEVLIASAASTTSPSRAFSAGPSLSATRRGDTPKDAPRNRFLPDAS